MSAHVITILITHYCSHYLVLKTGFKFKNSIFVSRINLNTPLSIWLLSPQCVIHQPFFTTHRTSTRYYLPLSSGQLSEFPASNSIMLVYCNILWTTSRVACITWPEVIHQCPPLSNLYRESNLENFPCSFDVTRPTRDPRLYLIRSSFSKTKSIKFLAAWCSSSRFILHQYSARNENKFALHLLCKMLTTNLKSLIFLQHYT